jgi:hypothetical protein
MCALLAGAATVHAEWVENGTVVCSAPERQTNPVIITDGLGGSIIAWSDYRNGGYSQQNIYAQKIDVGGKALWTTDGVAICTAPEFQVLPQLISDGADGAIVVWKDFRNNIDDDIYAQRVDADGSVLWKTNGVTICGAPDDQYFVDLISDGAGGAIISVD